MEQLCAKTYERVADLLKKNIEVLQLEEELVVSIYHFLGSESKNHKIYKPFICFTNGIESPDAQNFIKANIYPLNERLLDVKCMLDKQTTKLQTGLECMEPLPLPLKLDG